MVLVAGEATGDVTRADTAQGGVAQMARLDSIRGGTPGRPGDLIRGVAPQPPVPPRPPKVPKMLKPYGQGQSQVKSPKTRTRRDGAGADEPT